MARGKKNILPKLINRTTVRVRFSEVDSMYIVWHGNYVRYFEDGREAFGRQYNLGYMDIYGAGYKAPLVQLNCEYKRPLMYGDTVIVETRYLPTDAAKIQFEYLLYKESDNSLVASGISTQVFLNDGGELELVNPDFYLNWKQKWGV